MLVIISDLHLNDGSRGATVPAGAFQLFAERLAELAYAASWRLGGIYRPLERIDLVLLGDVLDLMRSAAWLDDDSIRPWSNPESPQLAGMVQHLVARVLRANKGGLEIMRSLAAGGLRIPVAAGTTSSPADETQPTPTRIFYMVGNHDWFFHLPHSQYDAARREIVEQMGLAQQADAPFPHEPAENSAVLETMRRHRVTARHGDLFDPLCYPGHRDAASLSDAVVIDLLGQFVRQTEQELGADLSSATRAGLAEMENVRPLLLLSAWLEELLERTVPRAATRVAVKKIWDQQADALLDSPFVGSQDACRSAEMIDCLADSLKFNRRLPFGGSRRSTLWPLGGEAIETSYARHALAEAEFRNRRAKHVVYGHTHLAETVPLESSYSEHAVLQQVYFNAGSWRRVYRPARVDVARREFTATETMTYLAFYHGDERSGRPFETWSGTLGTAPAAPPPARFVPRDRNERVDSALEPPGIPGLGPHFVPAVEIAPSSGSR